MLVRQKLYKYWRVSIDDTQCFKNIEEGVNDILYVIYYKTNNRSNGFIQFSKPKGPAALRKLFGPVLNCAPFDIQHRSCYANIGRDEIFTRSLKQKTKPIQIGLWTIDRCSKDKCRCNYNGRTQKEVFKTPVPPQMDSDSELSEDEYNNEAASAYAIKDDYILPQHIIDAQHEYVPSADDIAFTASRLIK